MKVYFVKESNDGNSDGWGDYVSLCGIYTDKDKANKRLNEFNELIDEGGYLKEEDEEFMDGTRYMYEVVEVELDKDVDIFLGGYAE